MYLISADYNKTIQEANLLQIINSNTSILDSAALTGEAELKSYLRQKYDIEKEFTNTTIWSNLVSYSANNRVYLDADNYNASNTYNTGNLVSHLGYVYLCNTDGTTGVWDVANFDLLGAQYTIFYAKLPAPAFNYNSGVYLKANQVFYKDKVYTCQIPTMFQTHEAKLQAHSISNFTGNTFPDDPQNGIQVWGAGVSYSVASGTDILDTDYWTKGDNRDQQLLTYCCDVTLFHVHSRISPRNIPQLRIDRYNTAIDWLKMCANGDVTPDIPVLQPKQGSRIRFGGNVKNINSY